MKNKKLTMFLTSLLMVSQLSLSVTVLAESKESTKISIEEVVSEEQEEQIKEISNKEVTIKTPRKVEKVADTVTNKNSTKLEVELKTGIQIPVGSVPSNLNPKDYIEDVYYVDHFLNEDEFNAEFIIPEDVEDEEDLFWYVDEEEKPLDLKISLAENKEEFTVETMHYSVNWGYAIISRDGGYTIDNIVTSLSILTDKNGQPYLRPNMGDNKKYFGNNVRSSVFVDIYQDNNDESLISLSTFYGSNHAINRLNWENDLKDFDLEYGNVLKQSVNDHRGQSVDGRATYVSRTDRGRERLIRETHGVDGQYGLDREQGYKDAYYEITPNGYRLLQLNQLSLNHKILVFETGDTKEEIQKQAKSAIVLPNHLKNDLNRFTYELTDIDTSVSTNGKRVEGTMKISEELETGGVFTMSRPIDYEVKDGLTVKLNSQDIELGTDANTLNPNSYVEEVVMGDTKLNASEYTASFVNTINTNKVGTQETEIKVVANNNKQVTEKTQTEVIWGSSLVSLGTNKKDMDTSVSLLDKNGKPYLVANEGTGLSQGSRLNSRITMGIYRENDFNKLYSAGSGTVNQKPVDVMNRWNNEFKNYELAYGDVLSYTVFTYANAQTNENGKNTWISRDGELVKETEGYDVAYYELTPDGFRLMKLNQFEVNPKLLTFNVGTTVEEMNKQAQDALIGKNPENYEFKFEAADTTTSGKKKTKLNVYETLATGGKFMTTYEVEYIVNPQVTEKYVSETGVELKSPVLTNFDFGTEYQVSPENFITVDGDLYIYQGWLEENQTAGKDTPKKETPKAVKEETTFQYVYKKADNMIDMTIPTEMIFSTERESKNIVSKKQAFKNNSKDVSTEIIMTEFVSKKSDVKLLTEKDADPKKEVNEARFNLMKEEQIAINSLNEKTKEQSITTLKSGETTDISLAGKYFGSQDKKKHVDYQMNFKFKAHAN